MDPVMVWARAALLAAVTMFVGVAGHVTADGLLPSVAWLVVLALLIVVPCAALLARPASALRIVLTVAGGQALVHLVLTVTAGHTSHAGSHDHAAGTAAHVDTAGSALETLRSASPAPSSPGLSASSVVGHLVEHGPMMAAHLVAATLVGLWLAVGEQSLWTLVAMTGALVLRPLSLLGAVARPALCAVRVARPSHPEPRVPALTLLLARCVVRRGPPVLAI